MKRIFIRLIFLLSVCLISGNALAVRAVPYMLTQTQSDGSELNFYLRGDENFNFMETVDGYELTANETGDLVYAFRSTAGEVSASNQLAHNSKERSEEEISFLIFLKEKNAEPQRVFRAKQPLLSKPKRTVEKAGSTVKGTVRVPVLLIEFTNTDGSGGFTIADTPTAVQAAFDKKFNQNGYSIDGHNGSVRDYFLDNSFGQLDIQFDVIAPVRVSQDYAFYGQNGTDGLDKYPGTMIKEALILADASVDFSIYRNSRNEIDFLVVIYAGLNEAESNIKNLIWPHSWDLAAAASDEGFLNPSVDGVRGSAYFCTSELMGASGAKQAGIGTICHEFCHMIGLHDLYDVDYEKSGGTNPGFGAWSLMDSGNYLNNGRTPPYLTAFEREELGWGTVNVLTNPGNYTLDNINTGEIYRINTPKTYEYFLLENRQQNDWDQYLPGSGMLITRVYRDNESYFNRNTINTVKGQERVNLLEANGAYYYGGYFSRASDAFPGTANVTRFDDEIRTPVQFGLPGRFETPANSQLWSGDLLNKPVLNIKEQGGIISFDFLKGQSGLDLTMDEQAFTFARSGNILTIESTIDLKNISVYNPQGQLLQQKAGQRGINTLQLPGKGIYLINLDGETIKFAL